MSIFSKPIPDAAEINTFLCEVVLVILMILPPLKLIRLPQSI